MTESIETPENERSEEEWKRLEHEGLACRHLPEWILYTPSGRNYCEMCGRRV